MSVQYPYTLQKLVVPASTQDAQGNFIAGVSEWVDVSPCRNEDGSQKKYPKDDGSYLSATHLIQCPMGVLALAAGEQIRVIETGGLVRLKGEVVYCDKGKFHTRIWV
ncbi:hypothetical protein [Emticicia sp. BO119]|uniref:hypothetical protein n=1 Tax=Emticicia sp. BO119 TaxID=2757768 RepID=UPI0015F0EBC7|nr:hypothetical protein [Emticicia sp. BO119]MBA4852075.1 hypothetical protein [Emticicia sp. BO119]